MKKVDIPSDQDAVRDHVVTAAAEASCFSTALSRFELIDAKGKKRTHGPIRPSTTRPGSFLTKGCAPRK